jgi:hypothetical protein
MQGLGSWQPSQPENIFSGYFQGYFKKKSGKFEMI